MEGDTMTIRTVGKYDLVYSQDDGGYYWHDTELDTTSRTMSWTEANEPVDYMTFS